MRRSVRSLAMLVLGWFAGAMVGQIPGDCLAEDWLRFRGDNGTGVSTSSPPLPVEFGPDQCLKWKVALPGPGHSSPIVVGDKVLVTCWSGYGTKEGEDDPAQLKRHLICLSRVDGKVLWDRTVDAVLPEDRYGGMFAEHGYASHTPVSDGHWVYVFYGKSGVHAYDLDGNLQWSCMVGEGLDPRGWGSSSSPILAGDLLIVLASAESQTLFGLDKKSGKEMWKEQADGFGGTWGTPILVQSGEGKTELVVGVPYEVWSFQPETGKFNWYCSVAESDSYCSSVIAEGDKIYSIEGRSGGGFSIRAGGKGNVTESSIQWQKPLRNRIGTPLLVDGRLYFFSGRIAQCVDAATGEELFQGRLPQGKSSPAASERPAGGDRGGRRGGGPMGGQDYASPVAGDGKIYFVTRSGDIHVLRASSVFESLAVNRLTDAAEDFSATPAISDGQLFIRSSKHLYCIEQ
ncbi:MAG: PQQ-binding-like beta-propeller repeat protein [Pirellulaceae bacterium]